MWTWTSWLRRSPTRRACSFSTRLTTRLAKCSVGPSWLPSLPFSIATPAVLTLSDEVYENMVYEPSEHVSIASLPGMWERTVTVGSAGKTFSVTGWKIGWAIGAEHIVQAAAPSPISGSASARARRCRQAVAEMLDAGQCKPFEGHDSYYQYLTAHVPPSSSAAGATELSCRRSASHRAPGRLLRGGRHQPSEDTGLVRRRQCDARLGVLPLAHARRWACVPYRRVPSWATTIAAWPRTGLASPSARRMKCWKRRASACSKSKVSWRTERLAVLTQVSQLQCSTSEWWLFICSR